MANCEYCGKDIGDLTYEGCRWCSNCYKGVLQRRYDKEEMDEHWDLEPITQERIDEVGSIM